MSRPIDEQVWQRMTAEIMSGMREWRLQHPKATLREMEHELDTRWARVRARMLEDMALASVAADWTATPAGSAARPAPTVERPCSRAAPTSARSKPTAGRMSSWNASMAVARPAGPGFSPLDEELGLLPGNLTPRLQEALVRLSTHIPSFAKAARELAWFTGAQVHPDTARQRTEAAGAVLVAYETAEAARHSARASRAALHARQPGAQCRRCHDPARAWPMDGGAHAGGGRGAAAPGDRRWPSRPHNQPVLFLAPHR